ncbi:MAG: LuxR C-terminal-related transcriptional regulator [Propionibacteriaceae bacterium]
MSAIEMFVRDSVIPQRLLKRLDALTGFRIAILTAPGGYNKTPLVRTWLAADPQRQENCLAPIIRRDATSFDTTLVRNALNSSEPLRPYYIFIDNHDHLTDSTSLNDLLDLLEHYPLARLIFAGRTRPAVPLTGLQMRGQLIELTADELAFTESEAYELFERNAHGSDDYRDLLWHNFGGWPIIYDLIANLPITWSNRGHIRTILDGYLEEEVFSTLDDDLRCFVEEISSLSEVTPASAAYVTGRTDSPELLRRLTAHGIPLSFLPNSALTTLPGVRDYLLRRLKQDQTRYAGANRKAANWLSHQGQRENALEHALSSQDTDLVLDIVIDDAVTHAFSEQKHDLLVTRYEQQLPDHYLTNMLRLVTLAITQPESGQIYAVSDVLAQLPAQSSKRELCRIYAAALFMARQNEYQAELSYLDDAIAFARELAKNPDHSINAGERAVLFGELGIHEGLHGDYHSALSALQLAASAARVAGASWLVGWTLGCMALLSAADGTASVARRFAEESILIYDSQGIYDLALLEIPILALAFADMDSGNLEAAGAQLARLQRLSGFQTPGFRAVRITCEALFDIANDDPRAALRKIEGIPERPTADNIPYMRFLASAVSFNAHLALHHLGHAEEEIEAMQRCGVADSITGIDIMRARLELARGDADRAYDLLAPIVSANTRLGRKSLHLQLLMMYGIAATESGRGSEALDMFQRAGVLADRLGLNLPNARHTRMASAITRDDPGLTPSEKGVLKALMTQQSLAEVAAGLFISQNTLKTHLRRIYRKLGVNGRVEAVKKASSLGMRVD